VRSGLSSIRLATLSPEEANHMTAEITGTVATEIGDDLAQELEPRLRGKLVRPTDDDYNEARLVWNGMVDKRPALIASRT
jgi:hypothetical protein